MSTFRRPRPALQRYYNSDMGNQRLALKAAIRSGDLAALVALAEAEGFGAADAEAFKRALTAVAEPKHSKRQTSRSPIYIDSAENQSSPLR